MTSRFPSKQHYSRSHGPAVGAAGDGMEPGSIYHGTVQSPTTGTLAEAVTKGIIPITIPTFHLSQVLEVLIRPGTPCEVGETVLVIFDENKIGNIIGGNKALKPLAKPAETPAAIIKVLEELGLVT